MSQTPENKDQTEDDGRRDFFLVVAPGFETLLEKEMSRWLPADVLAEAAVEIERGGISLRLPLDVGFALNRRLKIATRVLLRLSVFGCRDFPKLFKKIAGFPWDQYLTDGTPVEFTASTHKSRLFIKKRIEETCRDGYRRFLAGREAVGTGVQVLVRLQDDVCTLSLDTSGELLHKRGTKTLSAEAPLRETIAAALLEFMSLDAPSSDVTLIDPMVGSGTFVIEAAQAGEPIRTRAYAFESDGAEEAPLIAQERDVRFTRFIGFDLDAHAAQTTRANWLSMRDAREFDVRVLDVRNEDVFDARPLALDGQRWIIANPPYGERLKVEMRLKDYYELLFEACERVARPDRALFLLPNNARPEKLRAPTRWTFARSLKFENGGLPVTALLFINS